MKIFSTSKVIMKNNLPTCKLPKNKYQSKAIRQKYKRRRMANKQFQTRNGYANRRRTHNLNHIELKESIKEEKQSDEMIKLECKLEYNICEPHVTFSNFDICYENNDDIATNFGDYYIIDTKRQIDIDKQIKDMEFKRALAQYIIVN